MKYIIEQREVNVKELANKPFVLIYNNRSYYGTTRYDDTCFMDLCFSDKAYYPRFSWSNSGDIAMTYSLMISNLRSSVMSDRADYLSIGGKILWSNCDLEDTTLDLFKILGL